MEVQIQTGAGSGASRAGGSAESPSLISLLQSRAKGLLKKIQALRKTLTETTDPVQRLAVMKEILALQDSLRQVQAQIAELQLRDKRKAQARSHEPQRNEKQDGGKDWDDSDGYHP